MSRARAWPGAAVRSPGLGVGSLDVGAIKERWRRGLRKNHFSGDLDLVLGFS